MASFAENFRAGADVIGAGMDRSLRAQQLRLQDARMRLEERQLQQQATLLIEQTAALKQKREVEAEQQDAMKLTGEMIAVDMAQGAPFETALEIRGASLALAYPEAYKKLQDTITSRKRVELQAERNASMAANATERAEISREGLQVQRDRIDLLDRQHKDALAQKDTIAADKAQLERDMLKQKHENDVALTLLKLENRVDKSGRVISKEEYVTRLSGTLINSGIAKDAAQAAQQLGAVYDKEGFGKAATTGSAKAVRVTTKAQRDALPAGTRYVGPDGVERIRQ